MHNPLVMEGVAADTSSVYKITLCKVLVISLLANVYIVAAGNWACICHYDNSLSSQYRLKVLRVETYGGNISQD